MRSAVTSSDTGLTTAAVPLPKTSFSLPLFAPVTALPVAPPVVVRTSLAAKRVSLRPGSAGSVESGGRAESASSASRTGSDGSTESASSEGQP